MSLFYETLTKKQNLAFKARKKAFKKNKPCAICGRKYKPDEMMVAHLKPVSEINDWEALYDQTNWQVRCILCERMLNMSALHKIKKDGEKVAEQLEKYERLEDETTQ